MIEYCLKKFTDVEPALFPLSWNSVRFIDNQIFVVGQTVDDDGESMIDIYFLRALCSHSMESWKTSSFTCCWANSVDDDLMLCTGDCDVDDSLPLRFSVFWQFQWESVVWSLMAIHHIRYLHEYYCGIQNIYLSICYCLSAPNAFLAYIESDGCNRGLTVLCVLGNEAS